MEQLKEAAASSAAPAAASSAAPAAVKAAGSGEIKKAVPTSAKKIARPPPVKPKMQPQAKAAAVQVLDEDDDEVAPAKKRKVMPAEPQRPPPRSADEAEPDEHAELEEPAGDENYDSEVDSELPSSWRKALRRFGVDAHARLQLTLLAEENYSSASEIVWKLTKERDSPIENASAFIAKCVTSARKQLHDRDDRSWRW